MYPFKKFIQGPNLHDESLALTANQAHTPQPQLNGETLAGLEAQQAYELIISTSSNSTEIKHEKTMNKPRVSLVPLSTLIEGAAGPSKKVKRPKLTLNQLMRLCESNNYHELEDYLEDHYEETDMDEQDSYGWTLLMSAACAGSNNCLKLLLQARSDWTLKDKKGFTASQLARKNGHQSTYKLITDWQSFCENQNNISSFNNAMSKEAENSNNKQEPQQNIPIYCEACSTNFSNQYEHLKSIAHLFTSGEMKTEGKVHYGIPESNKGFQIMLKEGWDKSVGLGPTGEGNKFPVKTVLKRDREGVGNSKDKKAARITHFGPFDSSAVEGSPTTKEKPRDKVKRQLRDRRKEINFRREFDQEIP